MYFLLKKRLIIVGLVIILVFVGMAIDKAIAKPFYYNQNWLPPRIQQVCSDSFIGVAYNPKLEKRCRGLWTDWTNDIIFASPYL